MSRTERFIAGAICLSVMLGVGRPTRSHAEIGPLGPTLEVNEAANDPEPYGDTAFSPRIAAAPNGEFVVVWGSRFPVCGRNCSITVWARWFGSGGLPLTGDVPVGGMTDRLGVNADVVLDPEGNSVIVWIQSSGGLYSSDSVYGRRFDSAGVPLGGAFEIAASSPPGTFPTSVRHRPSVAADVAGNFMVVWSDFLLGNKVVMARRHARDGAPLGEAIQVNAVDLGVDDTFPTAAIARDPRGFVVAWTRDDGDQSGVVARHFDDDGTPRDDEFVVNSSTIGAQSYPRVATDATGNMLVVWGTVGEGGSPSVAGRRFDASGAAQGEEFLVNETTIGQATIGSRLSSDVAADSAGNFVVVWDRRVVDDGLERPSEVRARRYRADGTATGGEFRVGYGVAPAVAARAPDRYVVVWNGSELFDRRILAQRVGLATADHLMRLRALAVRPGRLVRFAARGQFSLPDDVDGLGTWGGTLTVTDVNGAVEYSLPPDGWRRIGATKAFAFRGSPCRKVLLTTRRIKAVCRRETGSLAGSGPLTVRIDVGAWPTRYCGACDPGTARGVRAKIGRCPTPSACN